MQVIGITGGIACGKTTLCDTLRALGASVFDADQASRGLTAPGGAALERIREVFGEEVFTAPQVLNRKALGQLVFSNDRYREKLNGIIHPMVFDLATQWLAQRQTAGEACVFLEVPLLFETGMDKLCHQVWCAYLPAQTQLERLISRDHLSRQEAQARIASQMPINEKAARSQVVIDTSGTVLQSTEKITRLYEKLRSDGGLS